VPEPCGAIDTKVRFFSAFRDQILSIDRKQNASGTDANRRQKQRGTHVKNAMLPALSILVGTLLAPVAEGAVTSVVLVHGSFADGSGWKPVADILKRDGYEVQVVQEPLTGLGADVAATRLVLDRAGPCVLVGHSWGGMIITEAGSHRNVRSLVYVNAFQPVVGETAGGLQAKTPPLSNNVVSIGGGFVQEKPDTFAADFAADLPRSLADFMAISQAPITSDSFSAKTTVAAWSQKPSYAVVSRQDRMINPDLERFMADRAKSQTIELGGSHVIFLSHPKEIAALIEKAAKASN
jgi:pimeloyl-ACP methyl ester carboxylesterase